MALGRRDFLKRSAASAALLAAGPGVFKNNAFAINPSRFQEKSDVSFVGSSEEGTRHQTILDVLEPWRQAIAAGIAGKTVLLKVNMVYWMGFMRDPALPLTHVDAVRAAIDFLRSIDPAVPIVIGDCTASATDLGNIMTMFEETGYNELATEYPSVMLADLNTWPSVILPFWNPELVTAQSTGIPVISPIFDPNFYVISICRPKTHNCMVMTGVNKNILMGAPLNSVPEEVVSAQNTGEVPKDPQDPEVPEDPPPVIVPKHFMHGMNGWYSGKNPNENKILSYNLFQMANMMYATGQPAFSILDAWEGMEGEGPVSGTSVMQYCAVAGIDPLAVDRIGAKLMGFSDTPTEPINKETPSYTDMRVLVWISNAGYGNYDLAKINFISGSLSEVETYVKSYQLPKNYTGDPSYETEWSGGPPEVVLNEVSLRESRVLDPKPYLVPQVRKKISSGTVTIQFSLPVSFRIQLGIYDLRGGEVRRLGNEHLSAGRYTLVWDGRDVHGRTVPNGKYVIRLNYGSGVFSDHVTLIR
ncbi:MAG: DUF362 domain-containing protein [Chitinispirillaceae bacterium]|nr:DUF362 domain-containing protein [Chitinispirillaceae bacterium]